MAILAREKNLHEAGKKCEPSNKKSFILADDDGGDKVFVPKVIKRTHFKPVDHKEILKNPDKMLKYLTIRLYKRKILVDDQIFQSFKPEPQGRPSTRAPKLE